MNLAQSMLAEFDQEMANTRKTLERVPDGKLDYKPHQKSMSMGLLAGHIAEMTGWAAVTCNSDSYDIPADFKPFNPASAAEMMQAFDKNAADARQALADCSEEQMGKIWSLTHAGQPLMSMPRAATLRSMILNHIIHHRAQLIVYLRMNDIPVPGLYGPSADEGQMAAAGQ